jgi:hypothetical protein
VIRYTRVFATAIMLIFVVVRTNGIANRQSTGFSHGLSSSSPNACLPCTAFEYRSCQHVIGLYMARKVVHSLWLGALGLKWFRMRRHRDKSSFVASSAAQLFAYRTERLTPSICVINTDDGSMSTSSGQIVVATSSDFVSSSNHKSGGLDTELPEASVSLDKY